MLVTVAAQGTVRHPLFGTVLTRQLTNDNSGDQLAFFR